MANNFETFGKMESMDKNGMRLTCIQVIKLDVI